MEEINPSQFNEILEKAKGGDPEAFSVIYKTYFQPIYRYIYFRIKDKEEAEDLTQDVFLKVYNSFSRFHILKVNPIAYFYAVARNTLIDSRRKKRFELADEFQIENNPDIGDNPQQQAEKGDISKELHEAIVQLSSEQQTIIILKFIEGYSNAEISQIIEKKEDAIRQMQARALKNLREIINTRRNGQ
jgi:RNA polymerase sigma-70 factor (ECF subfamily)